MQDGKEVIQIIRTPVVLAVGNAPNTYLRVPTLKDRMKYGKKEIVAVSAAQLGIDERSCSMNFM